jgi:hypothetical protein
MLSLEKIARCVHGFQLIFSAARHDFYYLKDIELLSMYSLKPDKIAFF